MKNSSRSCVKAILVGIPVVFNTVLSFWLLIVGMVVGLIAALFGVGGGIVTVPALTMMFNVDTISATGISTGVICFTATNSVQTMLRQRRITFSMAVPFIIVATPGAVVGSLVAVLIGKAAILQAIFAVFLLAISAHKIFMICLGWYKWIKAWRAARAAKAQADSSAAVDLEAQEVEREDHIPTETTMSTAITSSDDQISDPAAHSELDTKADSVITVDVVVDSNPAPTSTPPAWVTYLATSGTAYLACSKAVLRRPWLRHFATLPGFTDPVCLWPTLPLSMLGTFVGGLLGLGGGVIFVPLLTILGSVPIDKAIPISMATIFISIWFSTATRLIVSSIDWWYAVPIGIGSVVGSTVAMTALRRINSGALLVGFWTLVIVTALKMTYSSVDAMI